MISFKNPFLLSAIVVSVMSSYLQAQSPDQKATIAFRLVKAKTMHFDDSKTAEQHLATVKKLGCKASSESHGDHIDVTYECANWNSLTVANHELAHQWQGWMKGAGFQTIHGHPANAAHDHSHEDGANHEIISYQLSQWITQEHESKPAASGAAAVFRGLGCEVKEDGEAVSFRCPVAMSVEFASHDTAHAWQEWLNRTGFKTSHDH
ncbi:MAG: hypothetical protein HUJ26_13425 [Planctomycetaceae bacterium]|nr:hypothetical protein [Planctomycetaceae bacterium]